MQSIYRFRQADVGLFLKARLEGIGSIQLDPLALSVNFRSRPGIVDWVNETFVGILPAEDDPASGAVAFCKSTAREESEQGEECVKVHGFLDTVDEANRVVELVKTAGDGNVAVLVRARSHLVEIVGVLKRNGIPFQAIEIDQLGERAVIEDLVALTLALLHPADRVSWLAILRAPWCGLELRDLHALAGADHRAAIWDLLHGAELALSTDGAARIRNILPLLDKAIEERGRRPLRDWVEGVWFRLGGPACVENETALEDAAAYFDLLDEVAARRRSRRFRLVPRTGGRAVRAAGCPRREPAATDDHPQGQRLGVRYGNPAGSGSHSSPGRATPGVVAGTGRNIIVGADFGSRSEA